MPNANVTYFARWVQQTVTITLNANGGTVAPTSVTRNIGDSMGELPTPTRANHNFVGWYTAQTGGTRITEHTIVPDNDVTFFARWAPAQVQTTSIYSYRADGLRNSVTVNGETTYHVWLRGSIVLERNAAGTVTNRFERGARGQVIRSDRHGWYLHNARGDVIQRVTAQGNVLRNYRYSAFGIELDLGNAICINDFTLLYRSQRVTVTNPDTGSSTEAIRLFNTGHGSGMFTDFLELDPDAVYVIEFDVWSDMDGTMVFVSLPEWQNFRVLTSYRTAQRIRLEITPGSTIGRILIEAADRYSAIYVSNVSFFRADGSRRANTNPFRFGSMYWDAHRGEYMTPNRMMNPRTGRWTSPDPFFHMRFGSARIMGSPSAIAQSGNLFMFTMHNPVRFTDPSGLFAIPMGLFGPGGPLNPINSIIAGINAAVNTAAANNASSGGSSASGNSAPLGSTASGNTWITVGSGASGVGMGSGTLVGGGGVFIIPNATIPTIHHIHQQTVGGPFTITIAILAYLAKKALLAAPAVVTVATITAKHANEIKLKANKLVGQIGTVYRQFTQANFRHNLQAFTGQSGAGQQAHHVFPVQHAPQFAQAGIKNIHNPLFGTWVETATHQAKAAWHIPYNQAWDAFFKAFPNATYQQIFQKATELAHEFNFILHW